MNTAMTCEMCHHAEGDWYLYDGNAEVTLCEDCADELGEDVEEIE